MFSSFCEKTVAKIGYHFPRNTKDTLIRTFIHRLAGGLCQKCTCAYRVDGMVKSLMILSICTLWMTPYLTISNLVFTISLAVLIPTSSKYFCLIFFIFLMSKFNILCFFVY